MRVRSWLPFLASTVISAAMVVWLALWIRPQALAASLHAADWRPLAAALLLTPVVVACKSLRWYLLVRSTCAISPVEAVRSYLGGLALATLTPFASGELGRGLVTRAPDRAGLTGKVVLDKVVDLSAVVALAAIGLVILDTGLSVAVGLAVAATALAGWSVLLVGGPHLARWAATRGDGPVRRLRLPAVVAGLAATPRPVLAAVGLLAGGGLVVFYVQTFLILSAFTAAPPVTVTLVFPLVTLSTLFPLSVGGVGVREWAAVIVLGRLGIAEAAAFNTFFGQFLIVQALPALVGALLIGSTWSRAAAGAEALRGRP